MPYDATPLSPEQHVALLLETPQPMMDWLREQPRLGIAGICKSPARCVVARFLRETTGRDIWAFPPDIAMHGVNDEVLMPSWSQKLTGWFDKHRNVTHHQVLEYLESQ